MLGRKRQVINWYVAYDLICMKHIHIRFLPTPPKKKD